MSGTIWLIAEGQTDHEIVSAIVQKRQPSVRVQRLNPSGGGISRLASQLEQLIRTAQAKRSGNDCIVVLHDQDQHQPDRTHYDSISEICGKYPLVKLIIANDEIEAWLLSDSGVCAWLGEPLRHWNNVSKPKQRLESLMKARHRLEYNLRGLNNLLNHLQADGTNRSLKDALRQLQAAPCVRT